MDCPTRRGSVGWIPHQTYEGALCRTGKKNAGGKCRGAGHYDNLWSGKVESRRTAGGRKWGEAAVWEKGKTEQNSRESDALCLDC